MRRPLKATICNKAHPEYGTVSLPFPIQLEEYDENLKMLDALDIGGHIERDCFVAELSTAYPILKCLEGSCVNVDELDYLETRQRWRQNGGKSSLLFRLLK